LKDVSFSDEVCEVLKIGRGRKELGYQTENAYHRLLTQRMQESRSLSPFPDEISQQLTCPRQVLVQRSITNSRKNRAQFHSKSKTSDQHLHRYPSYTIDMTTSVLGIAGDRGTSD